MRPESQPSRDGKDPGGAGQILQDQLRDKLVRFEDLARCGDEIWIEHNGQLYRLRQTRQGKLILTK